MKKLINLGAVFVSITLISACTTKQAQHFVGTAIADGADTQVRYNPSQCRTLHMQCVQGDFQEWQTSEKDMGCSCKKL
ncbi:hypothetical protein [Paraglaciecola sp. L3A3]|uniref:hypothetical protein n=1 Tax=Paraglaciecola sp. L3A3 TaxID=2686358 RepID=UPI00131D5318|nr:hypothetical protein [Paraglaciecola sp. L3A3]